MTGDERDPQERSDDEFDPVIARQFDALDSVEPPDVWSRAARHNRSHRGGGSRRAMTALVAASIAGLAVVSLVAVASRDSDTPEAMTPASNSADTLGSTPSADETASTSTRRFGTAVASPAVVERGETLTVTPSNEIVPNCNNIAAVLAASASGQRVIGQLWPDGRWLPAPEGASPTWPACGAPPTADGITYRVPSDLTDGPYLICLTEPATYAGCATFEVVADASGPSVDDAQSELSAVLTGLGVDVAAGPPDALGEPDQIVCGGEELDLFDPDGPGWNETARRCFLDAHLAGMYAAFASLTSTPEGMPIVTVWLNGPSGVAQWTDSTRDPVWSTGEWARHRCERLTTIDTYGDDREPTEFWCVDGTNETELVPQHRGPVPQWFTQRTELPLCGVAVRVADIDHTQRQCFVDAANADTPAEFAYLTIGDAGQRHARWARSLDDGRMEMIELSTSANGTDPVWHRYECSSLEFAEDPIAPDYLLPTIDPTCRPVASSPPGAPSPTTTEPVATPAGCAPEPVVELVNDTDRVAMDVINYGDASCGYNADGEAMFSDAFRPGNALAVPDRDLAISADPDGTVLYDVRRLRSHMRLANIDPSLAPVAANDGTYGVSLPGPGCFVVTVYWQLDGRDALYTGLAETDTGNCNLD